MSHRFVEIAVPADEAQRLREMLSRNDAVDAWHEPSDSVRLFKLLVRAEAVEEVLDPLQAAFAGVNDFRVVVLPVEAALPKKEEPPSEQIEAEPVSAAKPAVPHRISREELYEDLSGYARVSRVFLCMVMLSTVVAAIGVSRGSAAIVIGAMVIAPLLGPNMALALATTLGDTVLARRAVTANAVGLGLAFAVGLLAGLVFEVDPASYEIISRTEIVVSDVMLALAAGMAGALAFTSGVPSSLVGVMVAVALLPPLVVFAMLLATGQPRPALGAGLLLLCNIVCINLAGVATFLVQGVSPRRWWEAERSKKVARKALAVWAILLMILAGLVYLSQVWRSRA
jgi:uncharacterized hydrophobic protein (TIGR00341 family)